MNANCNLSPLLFLGCLVAVAAHPGTTLVADLVYAKDGSGVYGYKDTPKLPWCQWLVHDPDRPAAKRVDPGTAGPPAPVPSDAIVLFDGKDVSHWQPLKDWKVADGYLISGDTDLATKESFGDIQLHVEWVEPAGFEGPWYNRGNNGVMLMDLYEIQIFDSFNEKIYPDGQCAAIYGQTPPLVNSSHPPGHGETGHRILPEYKHKVSRGPLGFGGHGCPIRFRNLWLRQL
jgi:hypothetical protein